MHHPGASKKRCVGRTARAGSMSSSRARRRASSFPGATGAASAARFVSAPSFRATRSRRSSSAPATSSRNAACKAVAAQPGHHYNPLFLYGGVGLGKTHLANAIGHATIEGNPDARVAYLSAEAFMTQLITALRRDRMDEFKSTFRKIDV